MDNKFTWLPFYKELSNWLLGKQNSQLELISKLKEIGITGFRDGTEKGKEITLQEIDRSHSWRISTSFTPMKGELKSYRI